MKKQRIQLIILSVVLLVCCAGFFAARFYADKTEQEEQAKEEGIYTALSFEKSSLRQLSIAGEKGELALSYDGSDWSFVNDIDAEEAALNGADADTEDTAAEADSETDDSESDAAGTESSVTDNSESAAADAETLEAGDSEESTGTSYEVNSSVANEILERLAKLTSSNEVNHVTDMESYGLDAPVLTVTITLQDDTRHTVEVGSRNEMISAYYIRVDDGDTVYTLSDSDYSLLNKTDTDAAQEAAE